MQPPLFQVRIEKAFEALGESSIIYILLKIMAKMSLPNLDMTRLHRLLEEIKEAKAIIESILRRTRDGFLADVEARYATRYAIVKIVEGAAVAGSYILETRFDVIPESYVEVFDALSKKGVISYQVGEGFRRLVGLRNLVVHKYWDVDDGRIYDEAESNGLEVVEKFMREIEEYVERENR